ncbi:MAG: 3-deoxy-D-manno-octulosonic acid transferase [Anaerolineae bacterium]
MFRFFYDAALFFLLALSLPKFLWQMIFHGKYRVSLLQRLGLNLPKFPPKNHEISIWIHAVSVGEARALLPLLQRILQGYPKAQILVSSTTETGFAEVKRSMKGRVIQCFLPFDFCWIIKRAMKRFKPNLLILVESDFWYNLLKSAKEEGAKTVLVSGKISERSSRRLRVFSFFAKRLFSQVDRFCVQNEAYRKTFMSIGIEPSKIVVTGNLKFDTEVEKLTVAERRFWKQEMGITQENLVIVMGSTHESEEELLLTALNPLLSTFPKIKILIVPRHPHRNAFVRTYLQSQGYHWISFTERQRKKGDEKIVLIDEMGLLTMCYQLSDIAIVGGSFIKGIGGHNIFEPIECGIPVLFGPYMQAQKEMVDLALKAKAAKQVSISELPFCLLQWLEDEGERQSCARSCLALAKEVKGSSERTFRELLALFKHTF